MFITESFASGKNYSEAKAAKIDEEIARFIEEAHQRVHKILSERRNVLGDLAHLLSQKESVPGEGLRKMLSNAAPGMASTAPGRLSRDIIGKGDKMGDKGKRDKGKREQQKKGKQTPQLKRKQKNI